MAFEKQSRQKKENTGLRVLPNNYEAEQAVLGAILSDNDIANDIVCDLREEDFYTPAHKIVFKCIKGLNTNNKPIDIVMLSNQLTLEDNLEKIGGVPMLVDLAQSISSTANCNYYVNILKQKSLLRSIIRSCNDIIGSSYEVEDAEKVLALAESLIYGISENKQNSSLLHISEATVEVLKRITDQYQHKATNTSLKVGFSNLDEHTNGFVGGQLIILAARPGCGKTSFAMNMVANIARQQPEKVVAVFNLEMSASELVSRLISNIANIDGEILKDGSNLDDQNDMTKIWKAEAVLDQSNVYIDDTTLITAEQILSKCRRLKAQKGALDFVVVDYLQLMDSTSGYSSKQQQVADTSRAFKVLAKELKVPVLVLSQMSRSIEKREQEGLDATPKLSDLRESGAIEQDADIVFFLSKGDFELFGKDGEAIYLNIAKHRNGSTGNLAFAWKKSVMEFVPVKNIVVKASEEKSQNSESDATELEIKKKTNAQTPIEAHEENTYFVDDYSLEQDGGNLIVTSDIAADPLAGLQKAEIKTTPNFGNDDEE